MTRSELLNNITASATNNIITEEAFITMCKAFEMVNNTRMTQEEVDELSKDLLAMGIIMGGAPTQEGDNVEKKEEKKGIFASLFGSISSGRKKVWDYARPRLFAYEASTVQVKRDKDGNAYEERTTEGKIDYTATFKEAALYPVWTAANVVACGTLAHNPTVEKVTKAAVTVGVLGAGLYFGGAILTAAVAVTAIPLAVALAKKVWNFVKAPVEGIKKWWGKVKAMAPNSVHMPTITSNTVTLPALA